VLQGRVCIDFTSKLRKEVKGGHGHGVRLKFLLITRREGIGHCVEATRAILHGEIKAKKFTYPLKLRNCGQPLIEHELEGIVVGADNKFSSP